MIYNFYEIQNSFTGLVQFSYSAGGAAISMAPVYQPVSLKDIQAGMKVYNYENQMYFTLNHKETLIVHSILKQFLATGQFPQPGEIVNGIEITQWEGNIGVSIKHFPQSGGSAIFSIGMNKDGKPYISYNYHQKQQKFYTTIDSYDLGIIVQWLEQYANWKATILAIRKNEGFRKSEENRQQNQGNYQQGQGGGYKKSYKTSNYGGQSSGYTPSYNQPAPPPPQQQSYTPPPQQNYNQPTPPTKQNYDQGLPQEATNEQQTNRFAPPPPPKV